MIWLREIELSEVTHRQRPGLVDLPRSDAVLTDGGRKGALTMQRPGNRLARELLALGFPVLAAWNEGKALANRSDGQVLAI